MLSLVLTYTSSIRTQVLYECNFDTSTENCFTPGITGSSNIGIPSLSIPNGPLSDVTSSCKKNLLSCISYVNIVCLCLCSEAD